MKRFLKFITKVIDDIELQRFTKRSKKENILNQDFTTTSINYKWSADITYIHTEKDGWTYLASVEDLYSQKIIGWAFGKTMDAELAKKALKNASLNVKKLKE